MPEPHIIPGPSHRKSWWPWLLVLLLVAGAGGYYLFERQEPVAAFTSYPGIETAPAVSPDGTSVAFA